MIVRAGGPPLHEQTGHIRYMFREYFKIYPHPDVLLRGFIKKMTSGETDAS